MARRAICARKTAGRVRAVLVFGEGGFATEAAGKTRFSELGFQFGRSRLAVLPSFAIWFLTDVWSLARVDSAMASQTGRLLSVRMCPETKSRSSAYVGEGFQTALMVTDMRLLTGVGPRVHGQRAALDETLVAVLDGAMVGSLVGVDAIMATEIGLAVEGLDDALGEA